MSRASEITLVTIAARGRKLAPKDMNGLSDPFVVVFVCKPKTPEARAEVVACLREAAAAEAARKVALDTKGTPSPSHPLASMLLGGQPAVGDVAAGMGLLFDKHKWERAKLGKSHVVKESLNPTWNTRFEVPCAAGDVVLLEVWDHDVVGSADYMGGTILLPEWYVLPQARPKGPELVANLGRIGWALSRPRSDWHALARRPKKTGAVTGDVLLQVAATRVQPAAGGAPLSRRLSSAGAADAADLADVLSTLRGVTIDSGLRKPRGVDGPKAPAPAAAGGAGAASAPAPPLPAAADGGTAGGAHSAAHGADAGDVVATEGEKRAAAEAARAGAEAALPKQRLPSASDADVRITITPHKHSKFCDRKFRVCTAEGTLREGEVLTATAVRKAKLAAGDACVWERAPASDPDAFVPCPPASGEVARLTAKGELMADYANQALSSVQGAQSTFSAACHAADAAGSCQRFLTRADVGHVLRAVVTTKDGARWQSASVGPIHPAPPIIREIAVAGDLVVGAVVHADVYYYGGAPGACHYSWIKIEADGTRVDLPGGAACPDDALPGSDAAADAVDADPRCLRLTADMVGCRLKAKCVAVRSDGDLGDPSGTVSKPSQPIKEA